MMGSLAPDRVAAIEAYRNQWKIDLLPEERLLVADAVDKRRREFAAGRNCAREALARLGWPDFPILSGANREPLWPPGVLGSITHCEDYCGAVAARLADLDDICGIGIDAELNAPLGRGVIDLVCTPSERRSLLASPGINTPALVFSAKESVYKAWFPIAGCWLGYQDVEIEFAAFGEFAVHILPSAPLECLGASSQLTLTGRYATTPTHVFTFVTGRRWPPCAYAG